MHKAKACVLLCIDFRFQKQIQQWLHDNGYTGHCDEIVVAGASRDLIKPLEDFHKDALLRQIELSVSLHDPDEILIIHHQDCGGFALDDTIPAGLSDEDDHKEHSKHAKKARSILARLFPKKTIKTLYARLNGSIIELL